MQDETDKKYAVVTTATAKDAIREQVRYIAVDEQAPENAAAWLDRVWTCIDGLEFMPLRYGRAEGYEHLPYVEADYWRRIGDRLEDLLTQIVLGQPDEEGGRP